MGSQKSLSDFQYAQSSVGVSSLSISNNQKFMISLSYAEKFILWNFPENIEYTRISGHKKTVRSAIFTNNSDFIVSSDADTIRVCSTYDKSNLALMCSDIKGIYCTAVSKDDKYIISGHENGTIVIWSLTLYIEEFRLQNSSETVTKLITMHGGYFIASTSSEPLLKMWNIEERRIEKLINLPAGQELVKIIEINKHSVQSLAVTSDNKYLIAALSKQSILIWDLQKNKKKPHFKIDFNRSHNAYKCKCLVLMNDNQRFIASPDAKGLVIYNFKSQSAKEIVLDGHTRKVTHIKITRDCRYAISAAEDSTIRIWDLQTKKKFLY